MTDADPCAPRALRAAVFATVCVALSAATYAVAGGGAAPLWALLIALAALYPLAWGGCARTRGPVLVGAVCAVAQLGLDYWFRLAQLGQAAVRACGITRVLPPMGETVRCAATATAGGVGGVGTTGGGSGTGAAMVASGLAPDGSVHVGVVLLAVQLLVALAAAVPLALGERAQYGLGRWPALRAACARWRPALGLAFALRVLAALMQDVRGDGPARVETVALPQAPVLLHTVVRRGPPPVCPRPALG